MRAQLQYDTTLILPQFSINSQWRSIEFCLSPKPLPQFPIESNRWKVRCQATESHVRVFISMTFRTYFSNDAREWAERFPKGHTVPGIFVIMLILPELSSRLPKVNLCNWHVQSSASKQKYPLINDGASKQVSGIFRTS